MAFLCGFISTDTISNKRTTKKLFEYFFHPLIIVKYKQYNILIKVQIHKTNVK